jgi:hypothetical protein
MHKPDLSYRDLGVTGFLGGVLFWITHNDWLVYVALGIILIGLFLRPIRIVNHWCWNKINQFTEWLGGWILLFLLYVLLVTPIGWIFQLRQKKKNTTSTWQESDSTFSKENLKKTW